eukprot:SAG22_NODE_1190_length_5206_cov_1.878990_7_plen_52_part_00
MAGRWYSRLAVAQGLPWYGYDYHCDDNKTGTACYATIGAKQGAPQITVQLR